SYLSGFVALQGSITRTADWTTGSNSIIVSRPVDRYPARWVLLASRVGSFNSNKIKENSYENAFKALAKLHRDQETFDPVIHSRAVGLHGRAGTAIIREATAGTYRLRQLACNSRAVALSRWQVRRLRASAAGWG